jgi:glycine/D-amino acid oxidase-like deaminating enzyme
MTVDVVVVGAGIVGLCTSATLLRQRAPGLTIAVVDREVPCAGATGAGRFKCWCQIVCMLTRLWPPSKAARCHLLLIMNVGASGQGYIWLAHRSIGDVAWELAKQSKERWQAMLDTPHRGSSYSQAVQWQVMHGLRCDEARWCPSSLQYEPCSHRVNLDLQQANGSILLATDAAGADALETRAAALHTQGIAAEVLTAQQTMHAEPAVMLPAAGGGLLVPSDAQLVRWPLAAWWNRTRVQPTDQSRSDATGLASWTRTAERQPRRCSTRAWRQARGAACCFTRSVKSC